MLLAWVVFLFIIWLSIRDTKKAILLWVPCRLLFNPQIAIKYSAPVLTLDIAVMAYLLLLFFFKCNGKNSKYNLNTEDYILGPALVAYFIAYFLSFIVSDFPLRSSQFFGIVKFFMRNFGLLYLLQKALNTEEDIRFFLKTTVCIIVLIVGLGIYQGVTGDNPFLDYVYYNSPQDESMEGRMFYRPLGVINNEILRYGMRRVCSFFSFYVPFGVACVFLFFLMATLFFNKWNYIDSKIILLCTLLLIIGCFLSNTKQAYIGIVVIMMCYIKPKYIFNIRMIFIIFTLAVIVYLYPELLNNFLSLTDERLAEEGGGSTVELRQMQWGITLNLFQKNPLFGNGPETLAYFKQSVEYEGILGAESVWFVILPQLGLLGAVTYIFSFIYLFFRLKKDMPFRIALFFLLTVFLIETGGGQKDMAIHFGMMIVVWRIYCVKNAQAKLQSGKSL